MGPDAVLQLRYTELLEKRIAQLESIIETTAKATAAQQSGGKEDGAKVTNGEVATEGSKNEGKDGEDSKSKVCIWAPCLP